MLYLPPQARGCAWGDVAVFVPKKKLLNRDRHGHACLFGFGARVSLNCAIAIWMVNKHIFGCDMDFLASLSRKNDGGIRGQNVKKKGRGEKGLAKSEYLPTKTRKVAATHTKLRKLNHIVCPMVGHESDPLAGHRHHNADNPDFDPWVIIRGFEYTNPCVMCWRCVALPSPALGMEVGTADGLHRSSGPAFQVRLATGKWSCLCIALCVCLLYCAVPRCVVWCHVA